MMNRGKEIRWMYIILFLSVSLLLITIGFTFRIFNETQQSFNEIEQTDSVLSHVSTFELYLFRTESAARLAIISNDTASLQLTESYREGLAQIAQIKGLVGSESEMSQLDSITKLLSDRKELLWRTAEVMGETYSGQYLVIGLARNESYVTNHIEDLARNVKQNERKILKASVERTKYGIMVISGALTAATVFSLLFIFFVFRRLHFEIKKEMVVQVKLQQKIQELDRSNTQLERFAYTASHDLQEPLRKLHAFSEKLVIQEKGNVSAEGKEIIERMQKFVNRMQRLIDDLLQFSRILSYKLAKTPVDLNKVLSDVKQNMSENIIKTNTTITATQLPQVEGYESQLQQLFQNLISNSIRYAKRETPSVITIVGSVVTGNNIVGIKADDENKKFNLIQFSDNGIGFDNKYADRIFEIFQRLHGKSEYEGTGIGLSICKLVTENHEGYIRAQGVEGQGAQFMVYLPVNSKI